MLSQHSPGPDHVRDEEAVRPVQLYRTLVVRCLRLRGHRPGPEARGMKYLVPAAALLGVGLCAWSRQESQAVRRPFEALRVETAAPQSREGMDRQSCPPRMEA